MPSRPHRRHARLLLGAAINLAGLVCLVAPAFAQEQEFEGPYVGASIGYAFQSGGENETILFDRGFDGTNDTVTTTAGTNAFSPGFCGGSATSSANSNCRSDKDDIQYHVRAGYDMQWGNWVVGALGEFGKSKARDSVSAFSTTPASYTMTRTIDLEGNFRLRAGYAFDRTLVYATGGVAYARIENSFTTSNTVNAFSSNGDSNSWGFVAGAGAEHKLGSNFSVGVEYLYTQYNDDDYRVRATQGIANAINPFILFGAPGTEFRRSDKRFDFHGVRATVAYRF